MPRWATIIQDDLMFCYFWVKEIMGISHYFFEHNHDL